jgi:hypothetical protein
LCSGTLSLLLGQQPAQIEVKEITTSEKLLARSYLMGMEMPPEDRADQLERLADAAARIQPSLAYLWSQELFRLASSMPTSWNSMAWEQTAISRLAAVDPAQALDMLEAMGPPIAQSDGSIPEDVRCVAANNVFPRFWNHMGPQSLERLRQVAARLGETGAYPYLAASTLIRLPQIDPIAREQFFGDSLTFYRRGSHVVSDDFYFGQLLKEVKGYISPALLKAGVETAVAHIEEHQKAEWRNGKVYRGRIYGKTGAADVSDQTDSQLLDLLPILRQVDPNAADDLLRSRPSLQQAYKTAGTPEHIGSITFSNSDAAAVPDAIESELEQSTLNRVDEIYANDPKEALRLASSLGDPDYRVIGLSRAAEGLGNTKQARQLVDTAQRTLSGVKDPEHDLAATVAVARAAVAINDLALAKQMLSKGFDLGEELFHEDLDLHPGKLIYVTAGFDALRELTTVGMRLDSDWTLAKISGVLDQGLQADLLVEAATAMTGHSSH